MAEGRIATGVGSYDHCDADDALHIEMAGFETRSQAQLVFQLVCEGADMWGRTSGSIGDPGGQASGDARSGALIVPMTSRSTRLRQTQLAAGSTGLGFARGRNGHARRRGPGFRDRPPRMLSG